MKILFLFLFLNFIETNNKKTKKDIIQESILNNKNNTLIQFLDSKKYLHINDINKNRILNKKKLLLRQNNEINKINEIVENNDNEIFNNNNNINNQNEIDENSNDLISIQNKELGNNNSESYNFQIQQPSIDRNNNSFNNNNKPPFNIDNNTLNENSKEENNFTNNMFNHDKEDKNVNNTFNNDDKQNDNFNNDSFNNEDNINDIFNNNNNPKKNFTFDPLKQKPGQFMKEERDNLFDSFKNNTTREFENEYFSMCIYDNNNKTEKNLGNISSTMSIIDFHKCEEKLKKNGIINKNDSLIIAQMDINRKDQLTNQVEYQIFFSNGTAINLSLCKDLKINLILNVNTSSINNLNKAKDIFDKNGYDIFNINDSFYNDICCPYTSENKTDLTLNDRQTLIYENYSFCEENCTFIGYNYEENTVNCSCNVKDEVSENYSTFNIDQFSKKVFNVFSDSNFKIIKCYKIVFSIYNLKKNAGSHIIIFLGIIQLIFIFMFFKNPESENNIYANVLKSKKKLKKKNDDNSVNKQLNPQIKNKISSFQINKTPIESNNEIIEKKDFEKYVNIVINNYNKNEKNSIFKYKSNNILTLSKKINDSFNNNNKEKEKEKEEIKYTEKQMNKFSFEEAIKYDKRDFIDYYTDKLKYDQTFIFTFFTKADNNNKYIKIILFIFYITMFISFNALFFSDSNISHINKKSGKYDFIYFLPKSIISSLCCAIINSILRLFALNTHKRFKNLNEYIQYNNKKKIKLIIFFILQFILFFCFWYFTSAFCIIYHNTQKHLIKDSIMSFFLSMILPFFLVIISGMFRIIGIKKKNKILFKIGNIIGFFN